MGRSEDKIWEAWGRTNALYTAWCAAAGQNQYRVIVLYAIDAHAPITQKHIADYTGLSKQTVSTVMRALKEEGVLKKTDKYWEISDYEALAAFAEGEPLKYK